MTKISNQYSLTNILTADLANSRLGINNVSPTVALDVTGAGKFSSSLSATSFNATTQNIFSVDGTERMRITSTGNVGIGTTAPANKLDVIVASSNSGVSTSGIAISDGAANRTLMFLGVNTAGYTYIQSNQDNVSSRPLVLQGSGGNVGIGTSSPTDLLTLYRNASADNVLSIYQGTNGYASAIKIIGNNDDGAKYNNIGSYTNGGTTHWLIGGGGVANTMVFYTNNNTERMRITSAGNVGIGTSAPTNLLQVNGTGYFSGALSSGSSISAAGTLSSAALSTSQVLYAANLTTFNYAGSLALTVPNALNSGSALADIRIYMIWATGFGDASHAGARIWLMIMNGGGTAYSAVELLGRDTDGGTGLSISRSAVNQITISSNGYGFIKSVSCMQLITN